MKVKLLELRDEGTFIPLLCVDMNPGTPHGETAGQVASAVEVVADYEALAARTYLLRRCGYPCDGRPNIAIVKAGCHHDPCDNDPYSWNGRTMPVAHAYIIEHWDTLKDGDVVDVEWILGESEKKKVSERESAPL